MTIRAEPLKWCSQCKRNLPAGDFLDLRRRRWKVTKCNRCAQANMRKWARTQLAQMTPDSVSEADE